MTAKALMFGSRLAAIAPAARAEVSRGGIWLRVNGELRQESE